MKSLCLIRYFKTYGLKIFVVLFIYLLFGISYGLKAENETKILKTIYEDPKGFFSIIPPSGWGLQEYTNDPRGKLKINHPNIRGVSLLIIGMTTDMSTIEQVSESTARGTRRLEEKYQQYDAYGKHEISDFNGITSVQSEFIIPGYLKQQAYEFLKDGNYYNLSYSAPPNLFNSYKELAINSLKNFKTTLRTASPLESGRHLAYSKLRVAKIAFKQERYDVAKRAIREGLEVDPENRELLDLLTILEDHQN